jgi:hypothetical protein
MFCGEGDFVKAKEAIKSQKGVDVRHHVIVHMSEKDAHNALWRAWKSYRDANNDAIFVKIDGDTILKDDEVLQRVVGIFAANPRVTGIQCPLDDYFTAGSINGLNCFSSKVTFRDTADELFCDRNVDVDHDVVLRGDALPESLRPAALHCHHSTPTQAFHYGVHRSLKGQAHIIDQVRQAWLKKKDKVRGMALLGAMMAPKLGRKHNYTDVDFITTSAEAIQRYDALIKEL